MSGRYEKRDGRRLFGLDPLDDPVVATWDAVVRGDQTAPMNGTASDFVLLRRFHALDAIAPPSDDFFGGLELRLGQLAPALAGAVPAPPESSARVAAPVAHRRRAAHPEQRHRFLSMHAAAALLAVLLIAGSLVLYLAPTSPSEPPSIPAVVVTPPAMETLAQLDLVPALWDMPVPADWEQLHFSMFMVDPGATFSTDISWYTSIDGPMLIVSVSGDLIVQPGGPARVYRDGAAAAQDTPAGTAVLLGPHDAIAFSSRATATGSNPGSEPVRALYGLAGVFDDTMADEIVDAHDVTRVDWNAEAHMILPNEGVSLSITHLQLAPLDTYIYEWDPGWWVLPMYIPLQINDLRIYDGAADELSPAILADAHYASLNRLKYPDPGPHTLINVGNETVDLYFLILDPSPDTATPAG